MLFLPELRELFVVPARQHDVHVVVPRHKAALSQRADQAAADEIEGEVVPFAEFLEIHQHIQLFELQFAQQLRGQVYFIHHYNLDLFLVFSITLRRTSSICSAEWLSRILRFQKGIWSNPTSVPTP